MAQGAITSYGKTVPQKRVVSDRILMSDPMEIPLISALGLNGESKFRFVNAPGKVYEWLQDTYSTKSTTCNDTDLTNDSAATTITVADGSIFQPGDIAMIDSEYIWVSAVSTNDLTVTRNYAGTQATHVTTSTIYLRSRARLEAATANDSHFTAPTSGYNYSCIFQRTIKISGTESVLQNYGINDPMEYEIDKKMDELKIDLTSKPYWGQRNEGSATTPRDSGGFDTFITTNLTTCSTAALTLKVVEDMVQTIWDAGGRPSLVVCGGWAKRKITSFFEGAVRTERSETLGGVTIDRIQTAMGPQLDVLVDRYLYPTTALWILTPDEVGFVTIREFEYKDLAVTGDAVSGEIVGEYGLVVACEKHHGKIYAFSTTT